MLSLLTVADRASAWDEPEDGAFAHICGHFCSQFIDQHKSQAVPHVKQERNCFQKEGDLKYWSTVLMATTPHDKTSRERLLIIQV